MPLCSHLLNIPVLLQFLQAYQKVFRSTTWVGYNLAKTESVIPNTCTFFHEILDTLIIVLSRTTYNSEITSICAVYLTKWGWARPKWTCAMDFRPCALDPLNRALNLCTSTLVWLNGCFIKLLKGNKYLSIKEETVIVF